jgi:hypothetical protein
MLVISALQTLDDAIRHPDDVHPLDGSTALTAAIREVIARAAADIALHPEISPHAQRERYREDLQLADAVRSCRPTSAGPAGDKS